MVQPICPHCGKVTIGEVQDHDIYLLVLCEECQTILGILPKFFQKCTWKHKEKVEEEEEEISPEAGVRAEPERREERQRRTWD